MSQSNNSTPLKEKETVTKKKKTKSYDEET